MKGREPDFSRMSRKRRNKSNTILNMLIGVVVVLIIITASIIFTGNDEEQLADLDEETGKGSEQEELDDQQEVEMDLEEPADVGDSETPTDESSSPDLAEKSAEQSPSQSEESNSLKQEEMALEHAQQDESTEERGGKVTYSKPDDPIISETIIDSSWKPIGTAQTGNHVSLYDGVSVDWQEKKKAIAYSTGIPEESLIYWKIKNGGSPQKSIGIVSTKDKSKKYQVYLEWVDGEGWKPVKMDVLNTLDFNY